MCPEQSTPLITAHSGLTSNSLIIFIEGGSAKVCVCDELELQSDYQVQIKSALCGYAVQAKCCGDESVPPELSHGA